MGLLRPRVRYRPVLRLPDRKHEPRFSEAFIENGLVTGDGSAWLLPSLIQCRTLCGCSTPANQCPRKTYRIGLVNEVTSDEDLMKRSLEFATRLAKGPVFAMGLIKQIVQQGYDQDLHDALVLGAHAQALARNTFDHKEGVRAFLESDRLISKAGRVRTQERITGLSRFNGRDSITIDG